MGKTRVGVLFRETVSGSRSTNQSADLMKLTEAYHAFCKKLRAFVSALKQHQSSLAQIDKTRSQVAMHFAVLTKNSPMWECGGLMPSSDRPSDSVKSFCSIHDTLSSKMKAYASKYQQFVVEYTVEWERAVTTRINANLKKADELRRDLDHYQKKVESLRLSANQVMAKGKQVKTDTAERLQRNEEKLVSAKQTYNRLATDLCILMEEVTERSWRDLHPLLLKCAQFDMTLSGDECKILSDMSRVVDQLKDVANANGVSPQPRLKDLAGLKPELLSTRPGGVGHFAIENDAALPSAGGGAGLPTSPSNMAQPPGSVGAQGMGGFPVQVSSDSSSVPAGYPAAATTPAPYDFQRMDSNVSYHSAPPDALVPSTTTGMMGLPPTSAPPPPTYDDLYNAGTGTMGSGSSLPMAQSAPSSGNLPPLGPSTNAFGGARSSSFNDADSAYSGSGAASYGGIAAYGGMAPAPSGPPPLPPSMPPPPPPGSMPHSTSYGSSGPSSYGAQSSYNFQQQQMMGSMGDLSLGQQQQQQQHQPYGAPPPSYPPPSTNPFDR